MQIISKEKIAYALDEHIKKIDSLSRERLIGALDEMLNDEKNSFELLDVLLIVQEYLDCVGQSDDVSTANDVLREVVWDLTDCRETAVSLYNFLDNYRDLDVIQKLLNYNDDYLSDSEIKCVLDCAQDYDEECLKNCIWRYEEWKQFYNL